MRCLGMREWPIGEGDYDQNSHGIVLILLATSVSPWAEGTDQTKEAMAKKGSRH